MEGLSGGRTWLVTGAAGFIGSHLVERLLARGERVVGLDDFSTGRRSNLDAVRAAVGPDAWAGFSFHEGDVADPETARRACGGVDVILHQAAIGSVPRSIADPLASHRSNVTGTLALLEAARSEGVRRFVYASSSSVYGDDPGLPKVEARRGRPLSPYAVTKVATERYAEVYARVHGLEVVGLRYFNVFGPRQDPAGPYAAVIPRWIDALVRGAPAEIYGDGETSRDFCPVENAVDANLLAADVEDPASLGEAYNVACGRATTLNDLFGMIRERVARRVPSAVGAEPVYRDFRPGDVRHSLADISRSRERLGYAPARTVEEGLDSTVDAFAGEARPAR
ncbi:MAG TPA: SDR family oxidoreductase [Gemmatimonadota bacterium]|nr:SDR family oxidoreductase [Gemmatimonadota bacterium]